MKKVLCVCLGNGDRSPVMAAVLDFYLTNADHDVVVDSCGILEKATSKGGPAAPLAVAAAKRIGLDISDHNKRYLGSLNLEDYNLIVTATDEIAATVMGAGISLDKIYNAQVPNPWPVHFEQDYEPTMQRILAAMYQVVARYFSD